MKPVGNKYNHPVNKFPNEINGVKILKHLPFEPKSKRYVLAECPECFSHWKTRMDGLRTKPRVCKKCGDKRAGKSRITHNCSKDGKYNSLYNQWHSMKYRCSSNKGKAGKYYKNITYCDEWKDFEAFKNWSLTNGWKKGLELDKDILCDAMNIYPKVYSPNTCLWITKEANQTYSRNKNRKNNE